VDDFLRAEPARKDGSMSMVSAERSLLQQSANLQNRIAVAAGLVVLAIAVLGPNLGLLAYAALVLSAGISMLWRPGEPPVLLFVFLYQWLQAATGPIYGNLFGLQLTDMVQNLGNDNLACFLEITGVLVLAIGIRLAVGSATYNLLPRIQSFVAGRPIGFCSGLFGRRTRAAFALARSGQMGCLCAADFCNVRHSRPLEIHLDRGISG
jgi:hypothetical protein